MEVIADFTQATMNSFAFRKIGLCSTIVTDNMSGFNGFTLAGYVHLPQKQGNIRHAPPWGVPRRQSDGEPEPWLLSTFHGVGRNQLQGYLDEFVYRHNRR